MNGHLVTLARRARGEPVTFAPAPVGAFTPDLPSEDEARIPAEVMGRALEPSSSSSAALPWPIASPFAPPTERLDPAEDPLELARSMPTASSSASRPGSSSRRARSPEREATSAISGRENDVPRATVPARATRSTETPTADGEVRTGTADIELAPTLPSPTSGGAKSPAPSLPSPASEGGKSLALTRQMAAPTRVRPPLRATSSLPQRQRDGVIDDLDGGTEPVRVTIGRIEVHAPAASSPPPAPLFTEPAAAPRLSLSEYLQRRNAAHRR